MSHWLQELILRSKTDLKLGADSRPSVLGAALQRVLFVPTQHMFEQVVHKVQPETETQQTVGHMTSEAQGIEGNKLKSSQVVLGISICLVLLFDPCLVYRNKHVCTFTMYFILFFT